VATAHVCTLQAAVTGKFYQYPALPFFSFKPNIPSFHQTNTNPVPQFSNDYSPTMAAKVYVGYDLIRDTLIE
jgi:hypothetical protein